MGLAFDSVTESIGRTPLIKINRIIDAPAKPTAPAVQSTPG